MANQLFLLRKKKVSTVPSSDFLVSISSNERLFDTHINLISCASGNQAQHLVCCSRLGADAFLSRDQKLHWVDSWLTCFCLRRTLRRCARQWTSACWRIPCGAASEPAGEQSSRPLEYLRVIIYERYETRFLHHLNSQNREHLVNPCLRLEARSLWKAAFYL